MRRAYLGRREFGPDIGADPALLTRRASRSLRPSLEKCGLRGRTGARGQRRASMTEGVAHRVGRAAGRPPCRALQVAWSHTT
jgi:hypothetical protein